jgi:hypothetical protein
MAVAIIKLLIFIGSISFCYVRGLNGLITVAYYWIKRLYEKFIKKNSYQQVDGEKAKSGQSTKIADFELFEHDQQSKKQRKASHEIFNDQNSANSSDESTDDSIPASSQKKKSFSSVKIVKDFFDEMETHIDLTCVYKYLNTHRYGFYWIIPYTLMQIADKTLPDDPPFMNPAWSVMKKVQFYLVPIIYCVYFFTIYLYRKLGAKKYLCTVASIWILIFGAFYYKSRGSCVGRGYTLDNYYHWNQPFFNDKYLQFGPTSTTPYDKAAKIKKSCKLTEPGICWHYLADGWENFIVTKEDKRCDSKSFKERLKYKKTKALLNDINNQIIAYPLIDTSLSNKNNIIVGHNLAKQV